jgi:predicted amino acid dehydrogenase
VVSIPLLPDQILQNQALALEMIKRACEECAEWGAGIVGLGAYTGIIGSRSEKVGDAVGVPVTTGNSHTVYSSLLGLRRILKRIGRSLAGHTFTSVPPPDGSDPVEYSVQQEILVQ